MIIVRSLVCWYLCLASACTTISSGSLRDSPERTVKSRIIALRMESGVYLAQARFREAVSQEELMTAISTLAKQTCGNDQATIRKNVDGLPADKIYPGIACESSALLCSQMQTHAFMIACQPGIFSDNHALGSNQLGLAEKPSDIPGFADFLGTDIILPYLKLGKALPAIAFKGQSRSYIFQPGYDQTLVVGKGSLTNKDEPYDTLIQLCGVPKTVRSQLLSISPNFEKVPPLCL